MLKCPILTLLKWNGMILHFETNKIFFSVKKLESLKWEQFFLINPDQVLSKIISWEILKFVFYLLSILKYEKIKIMEFVLK